MVLFIDGLEAAENVIDLFSAFCWFKNGRKLRNGGGKSLLGAMNAWFDSMLAEEKEFGGT